LASWLQQFLQNGHVFWNGGSTKYGDEKSLKTTSLRIILFVLGTSWRNFLIKLKQKFKNIYIEKTYLTIKLIYITSIKFITVKIFHQGNEWCK